MDLKSMAEEAARMLRLNNPMDNLDTNSMNVFMRWKNDNGKDAQVKIVPETILLRCGDVTVEAMKEEIDRLIRAGEFAVLD